MKPLANPYKQYKQQGIMVANPVELIIMLYDGCVKQLKLTEIAISEENVQDANTSLQKAQDIVTELIMSLDFHYPMSNELMKIYEFLLNQMAEINVSKNRGGIEPLINILLELRTSWVHVLKESKLIESIG